MRSFAPSNAARKLAFSRSGIAAASLEIKRQAGISDKGVFASRMHASASSKEAGSRYSNIPSMTSPSHKISLKSYQNYTLIMRAVKCPSLLPLLAAPKRKQTNKKSAQQAQKHICHSVWQIALNRDVCYSSKTKFR